MGFILVGCFGSFVYFGGGFVCCFDWFVCSSEASVFFLLTCEERDKKETLSKANNKSN